MEVHSRGSGSFFCGFGWFLIGKVEFLSSRTFKRGKFLSGMNFWLYVSMDFKFLIGKV
jgi:hypothetical protein